jgi:methylthioribose-1-phosphate isomerase
VVKPLEWTGGKLRFLDQTKLPAEELWVETDDVRVVHDAICRLALRGAPLIGIAAAYGVALAAQQCPEEEPSPCRFLSDTIHMLEQSRPTAVNLFWALNRQRKILLANPAASIVLLRHLLLEEALTIHGEDRIMCEHIAEHGITLLKPGSILLTHCNSGALATGGNGTALGIIRAGREAGLVDHVFVDETRPLLQGARLTMWELMQLLVPATLLTDNAAAFLMHQKKIHAVFTGADRIAGNGDCANKIGTYSLAILAKYHAVPFYIAAPVSTFDASLADGNMIPIEERDADELRVINGRLMTPIDAPVYSPAFDVTPNELIAAIISDRGILYPPYKHAIWEMVKNNKL